MKKNIIAKLLLITLAILLIAYGRGYWNQYALVDKVKKDILMGRYNRSLESLEEAKASRFNKLSGFMGKEDTLIAYNTGVVLMLMGDNKKAGIEFKKASESNNKVIKENAIYNNANLLATNMDFVTAAEEYTKALKIDPEDFKAKKNLERMRLSQKQLSILFTPVKKEREERIQSLKLLPWGNKYRYSGEQKIRW